VGDAVTAFFLCTDRAERHRLYAELARSGPVHRVVLPHGEPAWLVTGYQQARAALTDPRLGMTEPPFGQELAPELRAAVNHSMLNVDAPRHTRLRRLVMSAFTRRRVETLAPRVQRLTDELLTPLDGATGFDLIAEFAYPLPVAVICELLGVPPDGRESFRKWSWADVNASVLGLEAYAEAAGEFVDYLRVLIAAKRACPGDDLVSALVAARDESDQLSEETFELAGTVVRAGDLVLAGLLAANRDPATVPDAHMLDVARAPGPHLAFGHGAHFCLGAPLARLEAQTALRSLLARFPDLRLAVAPEHVESSPGLLMNGLEALPVTRG
jgi:cytochrome P450